MLCSKQENSLYPTCWLGNAQHSFALVVLAELEGELDQDMGQVPVQCAVSLCASLCCYKWGNGWDIGMIKQIAAPQSVVLVVRFWWKLPTGTAKSSQPSCRCCVMLH